MISAMTSTLDLTQNSDFPISSSIAIELFATYHMQCRDFSSSYIFWILIFFFYVITIHYMGHSVCVSYHNYVSLSPTLYNGTSGSTHINNLRNKLCMRLGFLILIEHHASNEIQLWKEWMLSNLLTLVHIEKVAFFNISPKTKLNEGVFQYQFLNSFILRYQSLKYSYF